MADDLQRQREAYAEQLREARSLRSDALVRAFATVAREDFLGPGPWRILTLPRMAYGTTEDDDPSHLYHNVLVAIDESRRLNNGEPASLAAWLDALDIAAGERVLHVGCGVGYYTAIIAEVVGPEGHVIGVELDPDLAARSRDNLAHLAQVEVHCADGSRFDPGPRDVIFVNAGATAPQTAWLTALDVEGRLLLPLTVAIDALGVGGGYMLKLTHRAAGIAAHFHSPVGVYPCVGARSDREQDELRAAYARGRLDEVQCLRTDGHDDHPTCWLHGEGWCLSTLEPGDATPAIH